MGNWASIKVKPDQESIACPGEKSAMSDPIGEDLVDNVEEFFAELVETVKDPIDFGRQEQWYTKDLAINDKDPDNFTVKVMFDGVKLKKVFGKENDDDLCRYWFKVNVDRHKLYMKTVGIDAETEKETGMEFHTQFHPNKEDKTVRIEVWGIDDEGNRRSGELVSGYTELAWVKPLLLCRLGQKVKVSSNIQSYDTGGRSALTEPLDDYFTADQFYEALVEIIKQEGTDWKADVAYKSDTEFTMAWEADIPLPPELVNQETGASTWHFSFAKKVLLDPVNRQIVLHEHLWQELTLTQFYRITKDPVRCEFWQMMPSGVRRGGGREACIVRLKLMKLISEAEIRGEVEQLASGSGFML